MKSRATAIDLDGVERAIADIAARYDLTRRAIELRLVNTDDGKRVLRPARKGGRPKRKAAEEAQEGGR